MRFCHSFLAAIITISYISSASAKVAAPDNAARLRQIHSGSDSMVTTSDVYFGLWCKAKGEAANLKQRPTDQWLQDQFKKDDVLNLLLAQFVK
jgi:hypothetical protein